MLFFKAVYTFNKSVANHNYSSYKINSWLSSFNNLEISASPDQPSPKFTSVMDSVRATLQTRTMAYLI